LRAVDAVNILANVLTRKDVLHNVEYRPHFVCWLLVLVMLLCPDKRCNTRSRQLLFEDKLKLMVSFYLGCHWLSSIFLTLNRSPSLAS
jgi:hypothetical protein